MSFCTAPAGHCPEAAGQGQQAADGDLPAPAEDHGLHRADSGAAGHKCAGVAGGVCQRSMDQAHR
jgi:hypothetical protein